MTRHTGLWTCAVVALAAGCGGNRLPTTGPVTPGLLASGTVAPLSRAAATVGSPRIYVTNHDTFGAGSPNMPTVTIYPASANGDATPLSTLAGARTREREIQYPAVGPDGTLYVSNQNRGGTTGFVAEYAARRQSGDVKPVRRIASLDTPEGVAVDRSGNLYVGTIDSLDVFAPRAHGTAAPIRSIGGSNTVLANVYQVFVDDNGKQYLALQNQIETYPAGASGNVAPQQNIYGSQTQLYFVLGVAADSSGTIYATNLNLNEIVTFGPTDTGNVPPRAVISSSSFNQPWGIFVDSSDNVYVANRGNNAILVFATGTIATGLPSAVIQGPDTGLDNPIGIAVQ